MFLHFTATTNHLTPSYTHLAALRFQSDCHASAYGDDASTTSSSSSSSSSKDSTRTSPAGPSAPSSQPLSVLVVSPDKDMMQLVRDRVVEKQHAATPAATLAATYAATTLAATTLAATSAATPAAVDEDAPGGYGTVVDGVSLNGGRSGISDGDSVSVALLKPQSPAARRNAAIAINAAIRSAAGSGIPSTATRHSLSFPFELVREEGVREFFGVSHPSLVPHVQALAGEAGGVGLQGVR